LSSKRRGRFFSNEEMQTAANFSSRTAHIEARFGVKKDQPKFWSRKFMGTESGLFQERVGWMDNESPLPASYALSHPPLFETYHRRASTAERASGHTTAIKPSDFHRDTPGPLLPVPNRTNSDCSIPNTVTRATLRTPWDGYRAALAG
jgi:hypothetical protein